LYIVAFFFAILAILISSLGLYGLASFVAEQRTWEIGLRKVLGASLVNLWRPLSTEFVLLVFISFLIAAPIAWLFMRSWLQQYHYRAAISWWIFAAAGFSSIFITLLTMSYQTIKTARMNPVKSLRNNG
jgi:putative ABC transport system permease protein